MPFPYETIETFVAKLKTLKQDQHVNFDVDVRQYANTVCNNGIVSGTHVDPAGKWKSIAFLINTPGSKVSQVVEYLEPLIPTYGNAIVSLIHQNNKLSPFLFVDSTTFDTSYTFLSLGGGDTDHETWGTIQKWNNSHFAMVAKIDAEKSEIIEKANKFNNLVDNNEDMFTKYVEVHLAPKYPHIQMFTYNCKIFFNSYEIVEHCSKMNPPTTLNINHIRVFNGDIFKVVQEDLVQAQTQPTQTTQDEKDTIATFEFVGDKGAISVQQQDFINKPVDPIDNSIYDDMPALIPPTPLVQSISETPAIPTIPSIPSIPATPAIPSIPSIPTIPATPAIPTIPTTPSIPVQETHYKIGDGTFHSLEYLNMCYELPACSLKALFEQSPHDPNLMICKLSDDIMSGFKK